ncbi:MAG: hypothetical protein LBI48_01640 [Burkholderiaceae bacterium]|jgi:GH24 family phage-related lysozyme (muramidase)|nr:hypothetical protein [Burkholderiaceae bacterium]
MKPSEIQVGAKYSNGRGQSRVVDEFVKRADGSEAVAWDSGRRGGVALLKTFAVWAHTKEPMTPREQEAHERRARARDERKAKYGEWVEAAASGRVELRTFQFLALRKN